MTTDKLNDLGTEDTNSKEEESQSSQQPSVRFAQFPTVPLPTSKAWKTYFMQEVAGDKYLEFQLLLMTVATGILDAMVRSLSLLHTKPGFHIPTWHILVAMKVNSSPTRQPCDEQVFSSSALQ